MSACRQQRQEWVDSSISKTINCPEDIDFAAFWDVYLEAYESSCKGCTTYRPNKVTGSVLTGDAEPSDNIFAPMNSAAKRISFAETRAGFGTHQEAAAAAGINQSRYSNSVNGQSELSKSGAEAISVAFDVPAGWLLFGEETSQAVRKPKALEPVSGDGDVVYMTEPLDRPQALEGRTYKLKWPGSEHALYITVNDLVQDGRRRPFEIFINSKNMEHFAWTVALTRMISAIFRRGGDVRSWSKS